MTDLRAGRRKSVAVHVGGIAIGGDTPVVVQSMTNTDTADVEATARQVAALARAGSELVRITVDRSEAAAAVPHIRDRLAAMDVAVPLVGDFHYIGHKLLAEHPACAEALDKYRINPGNVGFRDKRDRQFGAIVETALAHDKPVRIGVNWGSLDQELLTHLMDENARLPSPRDARSVMHEAIVQSGLLSAARAEELGMGPEKIIISAKVSAVQDLISVYTSLGERCAYALHLGLTEAGMGSKGIVASTAALAVLLQQGIGDTIRISLTPEPQGDRTEEVRVAQEILQSMGIRAFAPVVVACPGCGRTTSAVFQELAKEIQEHIRTSMPEWRRAYPKAWRRSTSPSWAVSSTARAKASTPISASACRARARRRRRRCLSTERRPSRCGARISRPSSSGWSKTISSVGSAPAARTWSARRSVLPAADEARRLDQSRRAVAEGTETVDCPRLERGELQPRLLAPHQRHQRGFARGRILAGGFAHALGIAIGVEQIIRQLKGEADGAPIGFERLALGRRRPAEDGAGGAGEDEQRAGLQCLHPADPLLREFAAFGGEVERLAPGHAAPARGLRQAQRQLGAHARLGMGRGPCQDLEGEGQKTVAGEDGGGFVEGDVKRRPAAPHVIVVHGREIVVHERVAVDALQRRGGVERVLGVDPEQGGALDHEEGTQSLAAAERGVAHGVGQPRLGAGRIVRNGEMLGQPRLDARRNVGKMLCEDHGMSHGEGDAPAAGMPAAKRLREICPDLVSVIPR